MRSLCDRPRQLPALVVAGFALAAALVLGTITPHLHLDREPAFFNEEHDLTLFASAGLHAPLPDGLPLIALAATLSVTLVLMLSQPAAYPGRLADPRAPPLT
jgi:hypothetical protein